MVIPQNVRRKIGINVGDLLEAKAERGKIMFTPKSVVDRDIAESLEDFKAERAYGPFETHEELLASLHAETVKLHAKKKPRKSR